MPRKPDPQARERMLETATRLFAHHGVHAVGLQQIIDECSCGKNLLYREFGSKDELVLAFLERCCEDWRRILALTAPPAGADPAEHIRAVVAHVAHETTQEGFRGCVLRNAFAEFPDRDHPAHRLIVGHYTERHADLRELAVRAGARDPDALADRIALIIDGVNGNGPVLGREGAAKAAVAFADEAVRAARVG
ncbi:TetR/AcrR family transcriptional regulator [Streptomyces sp. B1866]|uniref:TetR/AcrR family transcriptional regulator n=1 Tax=Streptomyces sp. B1866 TaxID=3075431 RepID=UPI00288E743B|nr:TetR/AcrR family transcriptional regulator [Streptomyces sp. B1866]MDT3396619.1 TetR/AcrR family transcriptional regulator [Streptomyces sp. B1866]